MSTTVYKKGNTHTVRGVECAIVRCSLLQVAELLDNGCVTDPKELLSKSEVKKVDKELALEEEYRESDETTDAIVNV